MAVGGGAAQEHFLDIVMDAGVFLPTFVAISSGQVRAPVGATHRFLEVIQMRPAVSEN